MHAASGGVRTESTMSRKSSNPTPSTPAQAPAPPAPARGGRRGLLVAAAAAALLVAGGATLLYLSPSAGPDAAAQRPGLESGHAPTVGDAGARVHIVEFLDPACETCATFYPLVKQMMAEHPGRIRLSVRHVPFHPGSGPVVAMLEASRKQGKYWQTLEALLASQGLWVTNHVADPAMARQVVAGVGLNLEQLAADMAAPEVAERMAKDSRDAAALDVSKTPEYFVNGRQMQSFGRQQLQSLIRDAVQRAY
jgi:protein-disulfide isomerase